MPDISLLQSDLETEVEESRIPSFFLTISLVMLIISMGAYIGLYFYVNTLKDSLDQSIASIKNLNLQETSTTVGKLDNIDGQLNVLKQIRASHTDAAVFLDVLAKTVHPRVYYKSAGFNLVDKVIEVDGVAANSSSLSRQVIIYYENEDIQDYEISDVSLDNASGVGFKADLKVK